ncbi:MAG: hypothetical protein JWQ49_4172 [Edaphobacter sp.]|jgi:hypothetical protein|nr:hypothetical protein [Edaphobacter sp.]
MDGITELAPLKITCTSTRCEDNLHCFRLTQRQRKNGPEGRCRQCGIEPIDWSRVKRRDISDAKHTIAALQLELIRHHFWHLPLSEYAESYAIRKGRRALRGAVKHQLAKAIGSPIHPRQGRQTPRETSEKATVVHYAQHATATCCRACLEEWHGIDNGAELTDAELGYFTDLVMLYVTTKLPNLENESQRIPKRIVRPALVKEDDGSFALAG